MPRIIVSIAVALAAIFIAEGQTLAQAQEEDDQMAISQSARVRAPELDGGRGWLNTDKPLSLAGLRGKVVLLDFWTYGCINCMHIIPDLKRLEARYPNQLVVIGVHSAKFENEKNTENIRRIILRYELEHPVVNDADFKIWKAYAVHAWPTQVLIDPEGYVVGAVSGEGEYEVLDQAIAQTVDKFRKRGTLNEQPISVALERSKVGDLPLAFPGKVLADSKSNRLYIADSNHNRVVITDLEGKLIETIGTGTSGSKDGAYDVAQFHRPQGMALTEDLLYVADTSNHLIRRVDLKRRVVETIAGTGEQSLPTAESLAQLQNGAPAKGMALNSPWDLQLVGRSLFIAMAGPHQIWKLDLADDKISIFAGTGREGRHDGPRDEAAFAQPSGLASDGKNLYVADSEANIIRAIDLSGGTVRTLAGGDLFEFGDRDGTGDDVRFQHPLGLAYGPDGKLLVADTYNHTIKSLDPRTRKVKTLFGRGKPGQNDGAVPSFYEPGGLSLAQGKLYVADTDNHAIRVVDLQTGQSSTLRIVGLQPPQVAEDVRAAQSDLLPNLEELSQSAKQLAAGTDSTMWVDVKLPAGYHLNPDAPQKYNVSVESGAESISVQGSGTQQKLHELPLRIELHGMAPGKANVRLTLSLFYCRDDNTGTCQVKSLRWVVPIEVTKRPGISNEIRIAGSV
jgi:DNA-binding beta-propeller fold protein YncE